MLLLIDGISNNLKFKGIPFVKHLKNEFIFI